MTPRPAHVLAPFVTALAVAGCAGDTALPRLPPAARLVEMVKLDTGSLASEQRFLAISSTEAYSRIARGAMACWFGASGRLRESHIFQGSAVPARDGGGALIIIHERSTDQPKAWGYKAFRIKLTENAGGDGSAAGGATQIDVENLRMADDEAARMRAAVYRWAGGGTLTCAELPASSLAPAVPAATVSAPSAPANGAAKSKKRAPATR